MVILYNINILNLEINDIILVHGKEGKKNVVG